MERVVGIGGVFMKARNPRELAAWYNKHLGIPIEEGQVYGTFTAEPFELSDDGAAPVQTVWSAFHEDTEYFSPGKATFMVNYRVKDLDKMLEQLRDAGVDVDDKVVEEDYGRFGWASDPEGNRFELWQPMGPGF